MSFLRLGILLGIFLTACLFPPCLSAGTITVGTKVIYPGGADQPPKEKDTGVKLKGEAYGGGDAEEAVITPFGDITGALTQDTIAVDAPDIERYETLLAEDQPGRLLRETLMDSTPTGLAYRALAMQATGKDSEAETLAKKLIQDATLPNDLRDRLREIISEE